MIGFVYKSKIVFFQGDLAASLTSLRELAKVGAGYIIRTCKIT